MLNELLCNAYKHAFAPGDDGVVDVRCRTVQGADGEEIELIVRDDGRGMDADPKAASGLTIVNALVEQLNGSIQIDPADPGTRITVRFGLAADSPVEPA